MHGKAEQKGGKPLKGRKILAGAWAGIFLLGAAVSLPVQAEEKDAVSGQQLILQTEVTGNSSLVTDGKTEAVLSDGTSVMVEGTSLQDGLLLMVKEITAEDGELFEKLSEAVKGKGTKLRIYDIYFIDNNGEKYKTPGQMKITIGLDGTYTSPVVYYVTLDGGAAEMESSVKENQLTFATDHNSYYALLEKSSSGSGNTKPEQTPLSADTEKKPGSTSTGSAKTGDAAPIAGFGILGCISAAGIAALITWRRKR